MFNHVLHNLTNSSPLKLLLWFHWRRGVASFLVFTFLLTTTLILHNVGKPKNINMLGQQGVWVKQWHSSQWSSLSTNKHWTNIFHVPKTSNSLPFGPIHSLAWGLTTRQNSLGIEQFSKDRLKLPWPHFPNLSLVDLWWTNVFGVFSKTKSI
jgi:hypothetical protein